jgi:CTP:molybdopterin cytidylyltransferase MocA
VQATLILAAGQGRRFGGPKAPYIFQGKRLVDRAVDYSRDAGIDKVFVVLGAWVGEVPNAELIINQNWQEGMGSSLRVGLNELISHDEHNEIEEVLVTLVDLPDLNGEVFSRIAKCPGQLVAATYKGVRGHPVKFARAHWYPIIETLSGDSGAKEYLNSHASELVLVEVGDLATGGDLDLKISD